MRQTRGEPPIKAAEYTEIQIQTEREFPPPRPLLQGVMVRK